MQTITYGQRMFYLLFFHFVIFEWINLPKEMCIYLKLYTKVGKNHCVKKYWLLNNSFFLSIVN